MKKKTGINFSSVKLLIGKKISHLLKIGHFSLTKFYTSQVIQKALFIPLKFYFKNRGLILFLCYSQYNWSVLTDRPPFWLLSHRKFSFFNYPSLPSATQPDYGIINLNFFLRFPLFGFHSRENITDKNFWYVLILVG